MTEIRLEEVRKFDRKQGYAWYEQMGTFAQKVREIGTSSLEAIWP